MSGIRCEESPGGVRKLPPQGVDPLLRPVLKVVELLAELPFQLRAPRS